MSNFKSYSEAVNFHMINYCIQTRIVLFEKFSKETENRRIKKYNNKIMFQPKISEEEAMKILQERRKRIVNLTGISDLSIDIHDKTWVTVTESVNTNYLNPYENNNLNSMWLDICELF